MTQDKVQDLSIFGLKYARFLAEDIDLEKLRRELAGYSYAFVYCYNKQNNINGWEFFRVQQTPIIDLTQSLDAIYKKFRTLTKRSLKKAEALADLKFIIPDADADTSFKFYQRIKAKDGVMTDIKREFRACVFFNAYYKNNLVSSISFYDNGKSLRCKHIVSLRKEMGDESKIAAYAARKLVWEVCQYAKTRGYQKLDLGGINFKDPAKLGVAQFKKSFGGDIKDIYVYRFEKKPFKFLRRILHYFRMNIH